MVARMIGSALQISGASVDFIRGLRRTRAHLQKLVPAHFREGPLHVITGARQEGKTFLAIQWLTEAPEGVERVLVVPNNAVADEVRRRAGMSTHDPHVIGVRTLLRQGPRSGVQYGIDESVEILTSLLGLRETPHLMTVLHAEEWQGEGQ